MKKRYLEIKTTFISLSIILIFLLTIVIVPTYSFAEEKKIKGWKEIDLDASITGANWCGSGSDKLKVYGKEIGHALYHIESGKIQNLNIKGGVSFQGFSSDCRYIFFSTRSYQEQIRGIGVGIKFYKDLYVYDTTTDKATNIYTLDEPIPIAEISPSGKYIVGPKNWKEKIKLPGGEEVKVAAIPDDFAEKYKKLGEGGWFRWSSDDNMLYFYFNAEQTLYLYNLETNKTKSVKIRIPDKFKKDIIIEHLPWFNLSTDNNILFIHFLNIKTLFIHDLRTNKTKTMKINIKRAVWTQGVHLSNDNSKLYIYAFFGSEMGHGPDDFTNLYVIDLTNPKKKPKLLIHKIDYGDVSPDGSIVFSRIIEKEYDKYNRLYIADKKGKVKFLKRYPGNASFSISPAISKDGKAIVFEKMRNEMGKNGVTTILIKDEN